MRGLRYLARGASQPTPVLSRRDLLRSGAALGVTLAASAVWPRRFWAQSSPRVVIIGAGLSGMTAAYRLWTRYRMPVQIYEARSFMGGRASTIRGAFAANQYSEHGGTFISTRDRYIRALARKLRVGMIDTRVTYPDGSALFRFYGTNYGEAAITAGLDQVVDAAEEAFRGTAYPPRFDKTNAKTELLDHMSVATWLDQNCPGGIGTPLGQYLRVNFETNYAAPADDSSALQIVEDLAGPGGDARFDERFLVSGGSDSLVTAIAAALPPGSVHLDSALTALTRNPDGSVRCAFGAAQADADYLILSLPFTALRSVDYSSLGFDALKDTAIQTIGIGKSAKVHLQFEGAPWQPQYNGETLSDTTLGSTWQGTLAQGDAQSILVALNGAPWADQYAPAAAHGPAPAGVASAALAALEPLFPGATAAYGGNAYLDYWDADPWAKGSYTCYRLGQMTGFRGIEAVKQKNVYFAGEHTSIRNYGTMDAAVESGERVAREVIRDIRRA